MSQHLTVSSREAADRLAIRELVEAYAHCADRRDAKGQMSLFTPDTHFVVYMNAKNPKPSQEFHSREALAPVFEDLNKYAAATHFLGQSTILSLTDERGTGEVYICALAPDADETSQTQQSNFPKTDVFSHIEVADGRIWLRPEGTKYFCGDLSQQEQNLVWATQGVPKPDLFDAKAGGTAWNSKPSWYIIGKKDHTVHPDLERFFAKRMGATSYELDSSHVPMLSQPERVIDVIRTAAKAVQGATVAAA